jgi:arylsulfatase A-like enzyme
VILVIVDDVGVDKVAAYGESPTAGPTPQIDSLAAHGVLFRNAWTYPVCSPARASMLTGVHPARHGVGWHISPGDPFTSTGLDPARPNLARFLDQAGYRTEAFGKWHMAGAPSSTAAQHPHLVGFDQYRGFLWGGVSYYNWPKTVNGATAYTTKYATTDTADDVIAALGGSEPFFLWVSFLAPHTPHEAPPAALHTQNLEGLPVAGNEIVYQRAMVQAMDTELGRILDAVDWSDTTVLFIGDNGTNNDAIEPPFIVGRGKFTLYEGGINVPLLVRGQAVSPGAEGGECGALVQGTDLFATILAIAGVAGSAEDSVSFLPCLSDPAQASIRDVVYSERFYPNGGPIDPTTYRRTARDERYKLLRQAGLNDEFYDLVADPFETSPLPLGSLTPGQAAAYQALDAAIVALPEPGEISLLVAGIAGLAALARLRRR